MVIVARGAGGFDFFQSFMQYLMALTQITAFAEEDWQHASSPECNGVSGFINYDAKIARLASIEAYVILIPAIYEVSKILVMGGVTYMRDEYFASVLNT